MLEEKKMCMLEDCQLRKSTEYSHGGHVSKHQKGTTYHKGDLIIRESFFDFYDIGAIFYQMFCVHQV